MPLKLDFPPEQSSYRHKRQKDSILYDVDGGFPKRRLDMDGSAAEIDCTWVLNPSQYQYFMAFYNTGINRGIDSFLIDLLLDQPYMIEHTAVFVNESLDHRVEGYAHTVSAVLKAIPIDEGLDQLVLDLYPAGDILKELEQLANYGIHVS